MRFWERTTGTPTYGVRCEPSRVRKQCLVGRVQVSSKMFREGSPPTEHVVQWSDLTQDRDSGSRGQSEDCDSGGTVPRLCAPSGDSPPEYVWGTGLGGPGEVLEISVNPLVKKFTVLLEFLKVPRIFVNRPNRGMTISQPSNVCSGSSRDRSQRGSHFTHET